MIQFRVRGFCRFTKSPPPFNQNHVVLSLFINVLAAFSHTQPRHSYKSRRHLLQAKCHKFAAYTTKFHTLLNTTMLLKQCVIFMSEKLIHVLKHINVVCVVCFLCSCRHGVTHRYSRYARLKLKHVFYSPLLRKFRRARSCIVITYYNCSIFYFSLNCYLLHVYATAFILCQITAALNWS